MEYTRSFSTCCSSLYVKEDSGNNNINFQESLYLNHNNLFNKFMELDFSQDVIDIPLIAKNHVENSLRRVKLEDINNTKVIIPLFNNTPPQKKKTFDSIIKYFFTYISYSNRIGKLTTSKGEIYYGGRGLILNSNYNPILMFTLRATKIMGNTDFRFNYSTPIIYINPSVFEDPSTLVNKGIIKKIIPYFTNSYLYVSNYGNSKFEYPKGGIKSEVIIKDFNNIIVSPNKPEVSNNPMNSLNNCLINYIDEITDNL